MTTASTPQPEAPRLRDQKKRRARDQILRAARELINTKGYKSAKMRDIAEAARISYQTLYNYFPAKAMIVQTLLHEELGIGCDAQPKITEAESQMDLAACLQKLSMELFECAADHQRALWREVMLDALRSPAGDYPALALLAPNGAEKVFLLFREKLSGRSSTEVMALAQLACRVLDANLMHYLLQPSMSRWEASRSLNNQLALLTRQTSGVSQPG